MGGKLKFPGVFKNILTRHVGRENFIVLDIGTFSVKALYVEADIGKKDAKIVCDASRYHVRGDFNGDGSFSLDGITNTCRAVLSDLKRKIGKKHRFEQVAVIGIGGGFIFGKTLTQTYIRDYPQSEIEEGDLSNILQKIQQRNYEQVRRDFKRDTGRSELEVHIINSAIQEIKVDGYQVINPVGFKGKEISCAIFNAYMPRIYLKVVEKLASSLGLKIAGIMSEPFTVFRSFIRRNTDQSDFILIDIGGSSTEVSVVRKGRLEDVKSVSLGGSSFTKSIAENMKVGIWEAENIKRRLAKGEVSGRVVKRIESIIIRDVELLMHGLEMVLTDMSQVSLLPGNIFLYGGGSETPLLYKLLRQANWRKTLSFSSKPTIESLPPLEFSRGEMSGISSYWSIALAIADAYIWEISEDEEIAKILKRSLRLLQA